MSADAKPKTGGWYYGWNIVAVSIIAQIAGNGLSINTLSLFLKQWSADLHAPISSLQLAPAAMGLMSSLAAPFLGPLADKKPAKWLFGLGLLGLGVFHVAVGFATASWQVVALYGLVLPISVCIASALTANAVVSRWFVRRRGLALGLSAFGIGMAGVVLPPIAATLMPMIGWRGVWIGFGLLTAIVFLPLVVLVVRDRPTALEGLHYVGGEVTGGPHGHGGGGGGDLTWRQVLARKNFWLLVIVYLPILGIYGGGSQNIAPLAASHGVGPQMASILLSIVGLSHVLATLLLGLASDRFGNRVPFMGLAFVAAAGAGLLGIGQGFGTMAVGAALIGAGGGLFPLLAAAIAAEFGSAGFGRAFGLAMAFVPVISLAPFVIAKTQETTGSYAPALFGLAGVAVLGGLLILLLRERKDGDAARLKETTVLEADPATLL
jgi:MFS family permease